MKLFFKLRNLPDYKQFHYGEGTPVIYVKPPSSEDKGDTETIYFSTLEKERIETVRSEPPTNEFIYIYNLKKL